MRKRFGLFICLMLSHLVPSLAQTDEYICGVEPPLSTSMEPAESVKKKLEKQADSLVKLVGRPEFALQVKAVRKDLATDTEQYLIAQKDAYLTYLFCTKVFDESNLSRPAKLQAIQAFKNVPGYASSFDEEESDGIFQNGELVAEAFGGRRSPINEAYFEFIEIKKAVQFNPNLPFEFHGVRMKMIDEKVPDRDDIGRAADRPIHYGVTARVLGR